MSEGIEVHSTAAMSALMAAVERFCLRIKQLETEAAGLASAIDRRCDRLGEAARRSVRAAERDLADADDEEEASEGRRRLEEAEARLDKVDMVIDDVSDALGMVRRRAAASRDSAASDGQNALALLARKMAELQNYRALTVDGEVGSAVASATVSVAAPVQTVPSGPPSMAELEGYTLPVGWKWIRTDEVDTGLKVGDVLRFQKVSMDEMVDGYRRLRRDILPTLDRNRDAAANRLREDDMRHGIHDTSGKLGAFEAFFSKGDAIHLQRRTGDPVYTVDNGRHRIEVARHLGWPAVPAKISEV